jgi:oligopeptide transport system substrate-binding protein
MKRIIALTLAMVMIALVAGSCGKVPSALDDDRSFTYKDSVVTLATNWNPHTYQTSDDSYPADFIRVGFYALIFNDKLNPVAGKDPFEGYAIMPEMAAKDPVDVTQKIKKEHPEFNIPESAESGYAYQIDLNKNACWEDGTPINADSYVYSMKRLLDPELLNYRATDYFASDFSIAGAEGYYNSGKTVQKANSTDGETMNFQFSEFVKGADGVYETPDGNKAYFGLKEGYSYLGGDSLEIYYNSKYVPEDVWKTLSKNADADGYTPVTDETINALFKFTSSDVWGNETKDMLGYYISYKTSYPVVGFESVGVMKTGEYQITIVLNKALAGFNLYYNLTTTWLVKEDLYEANLKKQGDAWFSTYNTSVETTSSYGPYKLVSYQKDKSMRFERNEKWYGYTDGKHVFVDPADGKKYPMYQTTAIDCTVVPEASTRKLMFLKGELMTYGLQSEDFATYRNSEYAYKTPNETIYFLIFNGHINAIKSRENNEGFDKTKYDLETITLTSFRKAVAVTYDKELLAATISPARSGGYGLIGETYIYDPDNASRYRDTDQAKKVLCDFYSVDVSKYKNLDEAAASITGYDPVVAKELYKQAFDEAIKAGYITDNDKDGKSDQIIRIEYCASSVTDFITKTIDYLNEKMAEVTVGTPFEGKIQFYASAPYGTDWSNKIKSGMSDTVLAGWSGSALNPFSLTELYTNPSYQYDGKWFDATTVSLELEVNVAKIGEKANKQKVKMNLAQWSKALNGSTEVAADGKEYNFGDGIVDVNTRLDILAAIEGKILETYNYIPILQNASMSLLSQQVYYVVERYNPIMSRGGIKYMRYNYDDVEWTAYVTAQGGELKY